MWTFLITILAALAVVLVIFAVVTMITRKRDRLAHEKLDQEYIYRKEPVADQVAQEPNKLDDNEVTRG